MQKLRLAAWLLVVAGWVGLFGSVWLRPNTYQADFRTYYLAAQCVDQGLNPYDVKQLAQFADAGSSPLRFMYPISALWVIRPLSRMEYATAARSWLATKALALIALLVVWRKYFLARTDSLWILVITLLGFQAATMWDVKMGNVSTIEQLFLWTAFACLARSRILTFAILIVVAAIFKLTLSVFLILLLLPRVRSGKSIVVMCAACTVSAVVVLGSFAGHPDYFRAFVESAAAQPRWLESNPSFVGLSAELLRHVPAFSSASPWLSYALALVPCAFLVVMGRDVIRDAFRSVSIEPAIMVACLLYSLIAPRLMIYSYMIMIVPFIAFVLPTAKRMSAAASTLTVLVCIGGLKVLPSHLGYILDSCQPLFLLIICWTVLVIGRKDGQLDNAA